MFCAFYLFHFVAALCVAIFAAACVSLANKQAETGARARRQEAEMRRRRHRQIRDTHFPRFGVEHL